ncbi:transketolase, N-terminal subunit [Vallitalea longa]|uniref:Transketolase, N-terminal subunit n=1 Tax=Vallitalea longa TaxID=2936439 RepID=A0A9W5YB29_9FIRM|nr:transketolase [Vallitalea longa]GKX29345.1 transketolase, N-terminal subunit [Vallitalea longa]
MPLTDIELLNLEKKAHELRNLCVDTVVWAGSGHIGGSLSAMDILTILYYKYLNIDPSKPLWEDRDRFILSKGHVGVGFAPVLADKGYIDKEDLKEYNHTGSKLGMHLDSNKVPGVDASTGSLGHGLPIAVGMALAARINKKGYRTFCLLGDGECDEGSVWEAAMSATHYKVTNLITIVDRNRCMIDGPTEDVMALEPFAKKWEAFGFIVKEVNGHSFKELSEAIEYAITEDKAPVVIIANTIKGCGIDFMADNYKWHYGGLNSEKITQSKDSLEKYYQKRVKGA